MDDDGRWLRSIDRSIPPSLHYAYIDLSCTYAYMHKQLDGFLHDSSTNGLLAPVQTHRWLQYKWHQISCFSSTNAAMSCYRSSDSYHRQLIHMAECWNSWRVDYYKCTPCQLTPISSHHHNYSRTKLPKSTQMHVTKSKQLLPDFNKNDLHT